MTKTRTTPPTRLTRRGWAALNILCFLVFAAGIVLADGIGTGQWGF